MLLCALSLAYAGHACWEATKGGDPLIGTPAVALALTLVIGIGWMVGVRPESVRVSAGTCQMNCVSESSMFQNRTLSP